MSIPTPADIEAAYEHGRWLRTLNVTPADRMLADLSFEVERLRAENTKLRASMDRALARVDAQIKEGMAHRDRFSAPYEDDGA